MTRQRKKAKKSPFGKMSFVERAGLLFGIVGLLADFTVLFTFATGISSLNKYIPPSVSVSSATTFFSLATGLIIIYGWFIVSWYLVRRTFVLLGQMPIFPLGIRSVRAVAGVGVLLIPLTIAWSLVNVPSNFIASVGLSPLPIAVVTSTNQSITPTLSITETPTPSLVTQTPVIGSSSRNSDSNDWAFFFTFCFPFVIVFFGFVIWLPINLLMPIIHVELLIPEMSEVELERYLSLFYEQDSED